MNKTIYQHARKQVLKKKRFYWHFSVYIAVALFFFLINMVTLGDDPTLWFFFPMLPWGVAMLIHYFSVFGLPWTRALSEEWEEEQLQKEMDRAERMMGLPAEPTVFPLEDRYETLNLNESIKEKVRTENWQEGDLV